MIKGDGRGISALRRAWLLNAHQQFFFRFHGVFDLVGYEPKYQQPRGSKLTGKNPILGIGNR